MIDGRRVMRETVLGTRAKVQAEAGAASGETGDRFSTLAIYSAFALIAAIVFGTLSTHPF